MRIFSKTHDYYDSAMLGMIGDPNIIYNRSESEPEDILYPTKLIKEINVLNGTDKWGWRNSYLDLPLSKKSWRGLSFNFVTIFFAGKIYQPLILDVKSSVEVDRLVYESVSYIYNMDQLIKFLSTTKTITSSVSQQAINSLKADSKDFEVHFNKHHNVDINDEHFLFLNTPVALMKVDARLDSKNTYEKVEVTKDVNLGRYQFHKQLNAFEAYQQLENYVSTVFGMQVPKIVEVSNKEKIVKAGFDLKTSFRKEKEV